MDEEEDVPEEEERQDVIGLSNEFLDYFVDDDMASFADKVAPDVRLAALENPDKHSTGHEPFFAKINEFAAKVHGKTGERRVVEASESTARATVKINAPMGIKILMGFELVWKGLVLIKVGLMKNPRSEKFLVRIDDEGGEDDTTEQLKPPFRVPRPAVFPEPYAQVEIVEIRPKPTHSPYLVPRPITPYVRVASGDNYQRTKSVAPSTFKWNETVRVSCGDTIRFTVMDDNKIGKNQWLAKTEIPLAKVKLCEELETFELPLDILKRVRGTDEYLPKDEDQNENPKLVCRIARFDLEAWWESTELTKREEEEAPEEGRRWWTHLFPF